MEIHTLPRYRGIPDSPRAWGEPDERGKVPSMHLRDYVVLAFLVALSAPLFVCVVFDAWVNHRRAMLLDAARCGQMQSDMSHDLFGRDHVGR